VVRPRPVNPFLGDRPAREEQVWTGILDAIEDGIVGRDLSLVRQALFWCWHQATRDEVLPTVLLGPTLTANIALQPQELAVGAVDAQPEAAEVAAKIVRWAREGRSVDHALWQSQQEPEPVGVAFDEPLRTLTTRMLRADHVEPGDVHPSSVRMHVRDEDASRENPGCEKEMRLAT
jgi:hypothetical protein